jgi:hypothetical protein
MTAYKQNNIIEELHRLRFDAKDALLKVQQDRPIDMSGIDERVEHFCDVIMEQPSNVRSQAEPIMSDVISTLEELAYALKDAIDNDDGAEDWPDQENEH